MAPCQIDIEMTDRGGSVQLDRSTGASIPRSKAKSMGLVNKPSAPLSIALGTALKRMLACRYWKTLPLVPWELPLFPESVQNLKAPGATYGFNRSFR